MKRLLAFLFLLVAVLNPVYAGSVHIVLSEESHSNRHAADAVKSALHSQGIDDIGLIATADQFSANRLADDDLLVSIGEAAAQHISQRYANISQLYSYIDSTSLPVKPATHWAALVLDQPVQQLFDTAKSILNQRLGKEIILAVSTNNLVMQEQINNLNVGNDAELKVLLIDESIEPAKVIDKALFNAGALIAIRDKRVWAGENAKWMLYQSYKYKVPVIGYSKSFLKAGALVSVYSDLNDTADETANLIAQWYNNKRKLKEEGIHYPTSTVEYNKNIARALNITIPQSELKNVRD